MSPEGIVIIIGACSAFVAGVIVSFRNIRESECSWTSCHCRQDPDMDEEQSIGNVSQV